MLFDQFCTPTVVTDESICNKISTKSQEMKKLNLNVYIVFVVERV